MGERALDGRRSCLQLWSNLSQPFSPKNNWQYCKMTNGHSPPQSSFFFFFFSFNCLLQQNTDYWKFTLNATVSFTRCTIVKMGEDRSAWKRWRCWSRYGRLDGGTNFKCNPSNISHYFRYGPQGETVALKVMHRGMLFWMHLFIHLFKQSKPCIASTSELCILSGSNSDMFWDLRAGLLNEQTS